MHFASDVNDVFVLWNMNQPLFVFERPTPPALENTVKTMLWSNPHKIGNIYYERIFVLFDQATI